MVALIKAASRSFFRKRPGSVSAALCRVFPRRVVWKICGTAEAADVIDLLADRTNIERTEILRRAAEQLGIGFATELEKPDTALLMRVGLDHDTMRAKTIIPQRNELSREGFALIVADPTAVDIAAFTQAGVPVLLGSGREIRQMWSTVVDDEALAVSGNVISDAVLRVLCRLVADSFKLGASEVVLDGRDRRHYTGSVGTRHFQGTIHERVHFEAARAVEKQGKLELSSTPKAVVTQAADRPGLCLRWSTPVPRNDRALLLIEDDDRFAGVVIQMLSARGYSVTRARNGIEALHLLRGREAEPGVIVCDLHMPHMDGNDFVYALRASGRTTPVVMLTSEKETLREADCLLSGADAYLSKEEDPRLLLAWLQKFLVGGSAACRSVRN